MLLEFKVSNYRSIGEEQTISLIPAPKQKDHEQNIILKNKYSALNAIVLYGANASGKSNFLDAIRLLKTIIYFSARTPSTSKLPYDPFILREGWKDKPTTFEILFLIDENRYRYGFEFNADKIQKEWLFRKSTGREVNLFEREGEIIDVSSGFNGKGKIIDTAINATRVNALFLSTCDILNVEEAKSIMKWLNWVNVIGGLNTEIQGVITAELLQNNEYRDKIKNFLSSICLNVIDIDVMTKQGLNHEMSYTFFAKHRLYDAEKKPTESVYSWKWNERESAGAQQALHLSGPILETLSNGGVLIIDEIEAKLHPIMTLNTIDVFLNKESNPNNAQLIFATHDTNLLSYSKLRRDQIYFAEKNEWESTELYSLSDFVYFGERNGEFISEKERPDTDKEKRYIEGRYGAIPILGDFQNFIRNIQWQKEEK